jgi:hypothetical protein
MGAKTSLLVFADGDAVEILRAGPALDREWARELAARLHPGLSVTTLADGGSRRELQLLKHLLEHTNMTNGPQRLGWEQKQALVLADDRRDEGGPS